jgi:hypothetical protein
MNVHEWHERFVARLIERGVPPQMALENLDKGSVEELRAAIGPLLRDRPEDVADIELRLHHGPAGHCPATRT